MSKRYCYWCGSELKNYHSHAKVTGAMGHSLVKLAFDNGEEIALPLAWFQGTPVWTELAKQKRLDD